MQRMAGGGVGWVGVGGAAAGGVCGADDGSRRQSSSFLAPWLSGSVCPSLHVAPPRPPTSAWSRSLRALLQGSERTDPKGAAAQPPGTGRGHTGQGQTRWVPGLCWALIRTVEAEIASQSRAAGVVTIQ